MLHTSEVAAPGPGVPAGNAISLRFAVHTDARARYDAVPRRPAGEVDLERRREPVATGNRFVIGDAERARSTWAGPIVDAVGSYGWSAVRRATELRHGLRKSRVTRKRVRKTDRVVEVAPLQERQCFVDPRSVDVTATMARPYPGVHVCCRVAKIRRKPASGIDEIEHAEPKLLEPVFAVAAAGRLAGRLHRRQQQADERPDDRDHHEQFHEREAPAACGHGCSSGGG